MDIIQINTNQFGTESSSSNPLPFNSSDPFNYQVSPSNSLMFSGTNQADNLYLKVAANHLEFSTDGSYFYQINGLTLSNNTNISVNLAGNDSLYVDSSLVQALNSTGAKLSFDGGQGNNTLFGPNLDTTWNITGQNSGNFSGIEFQNVENLKAAANNYATFVFTLNGSLSGVADGGDGNLGTLVLQGGSYTSTNFIASGPHSGEILLDTKTIQYAGLAPIFDNSVTADRVFTATNGNDQILVTKAATGQTSISSSNNTFESITFLNPSNSLTIDGLGGDDTTTIGSLDPNFTKSLVINGDSGNDSVIFANNLTINGGNLTVNAENITVNNGVTIDTTSPGGTDGIISFTASDTESGSNASGQVQINLSGATIKAGSINMSATSTVTGSVTSLPTALVNLDSTANIAVIDSQIESSGNITIASSSTVTGTASAQGLSSYIDTSVDAAVATSIINSSAITHISGTSSIVASGYLSVTATNNINTITNGDATAATAGAGIAVATVTSTTDAYIDSSSNQSISASNITLAADSDNSITTTAKASPGGSTQNDQTPQSRTKNNAKTSDGDVQVAGALAFTDLSSNTEAYISPTNSSIGATVTTGALTIHAASKNNTSTLADGSNVGSSATGVGVAVAINLADVTNQAYVGSKTSLNTSTTNIEALTPTTNTFVAEAISGAGNSSKVGVAGALALNNLNTSSQALLLTDAIVDANDGAVTLTAENNTISTTKAEAAQTGAGTVGVGASVALDLEQNSAEASIQDNVSLSNAGVLTLAATSNNTSTTNVQAGGAGGIAVSPAVGLTIVNNNTLATIGTGGVLTVGSLDATAQHSGNSSTTVDATAAGDKVGIGASIALNIVDDSTTATTARSITATTGGVSFGAFAHASTGATAKASAAGAAPPASTDKQQTAQDQADTEISSSGDPNATQDQGAISGKAKTSDGSVSIAAGLALNLDTSSTQASLADGLVINTPGEFTLATSNETDASAIADGTAVDGSNKIGIGAAVALNIVNLTNTATIGASTTGNANVTAKGVSVSDQMSDPSLGGDGVSDFTATATSGAGASTVGVAGSFALNYIGSNSSLASINSGAIVNAGGGDVSITAENKTQATTTANAIQAAGSSSPKVGVGASFALDLEINNNATATIQNNATLLNAGNLILSATSNNTSTTNVQAGGAGGIAVSPAVGLTIVNNNTLATIGTGGLLTVGSLSATAQHLGNSSTTVDATAAGDKVGIGAAISLNIIDDSTTANTGRSITATTGGVSFGAFAYASTGATAKASAAGAAPPASTDKQQTSQDQADTEISSSGDPNATQDQGAISGKAKSNSDGSVSIAAGLALNLDTSTTSATLASNLVINAVGEFTLSASNETDGSAIADGSAVDGSNKIGIGAAVALNIVTASNQATLGSGAQITAQGVAVEAQMSNTSLGGDGVSDFNAQSTSGAGGTTVGVAGSFALNYINNSNQAVIQSGANVNAGSGDITLIAANNEVDNVKATSQTTSGKVGVGASIGMNLLLSNQVTAEVQSGVTLSGNGALTIDATSERIVNTDAEAGSSGGVAVSPAVALAIVTNNTTAQLGSGSGTLNLTGNVSIQAEHTGSVMTSGNATAAGDTVAVGAIVGVNVINDNTTATVLRNLTTSGGSVVISSDSNLTSSAEILASASGNSQNGRNADDEASAQSGESLPKAQDSVNSANTQASSESSAPGGAGGGSQGGSVGVAAAIGVNWQIATNTATVGNSISLITDGGAVTVSATSQTSATARAIGTSLSSQSKANVSAAVGLNVATVTNTASVGSQAVINAQSTNGQTGDITIQAITPNQQSNEFVVWGLAAAGSSSANSKASVAGSVGVNVLNFNNQALIGNGAQLATSGGVSLTSNSPIILQNLAIAGAFSGSSSGGAVGAAISVNTVTQSTTSVLGTNVSIDASGSVNISATSSVSPRTVPLQDLIDVVDARSSPSSDAAIDSVPLQDLIDVDAVSGGIPSINIPNIPGIDQLFPQLQTLAQPIVNELNTVISNAENSFAGSGTALSTYYSHVSSQLNSLVNEFSAGTLTAQSYVTQLIDLAKAIAPNIPGTSQLLLEFENVAQPIVDQLNTFISNVENSNPTPALAASYQQASSQLNSLIQQNISGAIDSLDYLTKLIALANSVAPNLVQNLQFSQVVQPLVDNLQSVLNSGKNLTPALAPLYSQLSNQLDSLVNQIQQGQINLQSFVTQYINLTESLATNFFQNLATDVLNLVPFSSVAIGGAVSDGKLGVGGSVIVDIFNVNTTANVGSGAQINQGVNTKAGANQSFSLTASDNTNIQNVAGGLGAGTGAVGIGIGVDVEILNRNVGTYIASLTPSATKVSAAQGVSIESSTTENISNLTLSGGLAGTLGIGGTVSVNSITNSVTAGSSGTITTQGNVNVTATNNSTIQALAGGFAVAASLTSGGNKASIGAAIALNNITSTTQATIDAANVTTSGALNINATSTAAITSISIAGSGSVSKGSSSLSFAAGASIAINTINNSIIAAIDSDSTVQVGGQNSLSIDAIDNSTIKAFSLGGALDLAASGGNTGATLAIGVSAATNQINGTTAAYIDSSTIGSLNNANLNLNIQALSTDTISAQSIAVAIAVSQGSTGVSLSGGGAGAGNYILTKTNAYVNNSNLTNHIGNVALTANNTSTIDATVVAISGSISVGSTTGVGASIGAAVANNYIGYDQSSNRNPSQVQAYIQSSSIQANGDLILNALANENITAKVGAGSVAVAASTGGTGLSGSGSGVVTTNKIATQTEAFVNGDGATGIQAKSATLTATDSSQITADAGAASIAVAAASTTGGSLSIGVAVATNLISNQVAAFINNATHSFQTTTGDITIAAISNPTISAKSVAASIAVGAAGTTGVGISGAGAAAINTILTNDNAYISNSVVTSAGAVNVSATSTATISATIAAVSAAVGAAGTTGVGVSIGAAVANNYIGYNGSTRQPAEVEAYIQNSSLTAVGDLSLTALNSGTINAAVGAGSAAISGGGTTGVAASGSGVSTQNNIATLVEAFIDGDGATGIQVKSVNLTANDASSITANAGAASIAASFGGTAGVSVSIGVSLANNLISNEVAVYINNASHSLKTSTGDVTLTANSNPNIQAISVAASLAASFGGTAGVAISGAGAEADNTILTNTDSYIAGSVVNSAGAVSLTTTNTARISATIAAVSASVSGGGTAGVGVSIGAAVATNLIGYDQSGDSLPAEVEAYILNSSINAVGALTLSAIAQETINAGVSAGSAAISGGGTAGVSASGSGVSTTNKVGSLIYAFINGDGATGIQAKSVSLTANDASSITANAGAASIAASFSGTASVSLSIGVALAHNVVTNQVEAYIQNASHFLKTTTGDVLLSATTNVTINAVAVAASLAAGISGTAGIAVSGAGAESTNNISTKTDAYTQGSVINSAGAVNISGTNTSAISATIAAASAAVGASGTAGVAASIGVAIARNEIGWGIDPTNTSYNYTTGSGTQSLNQGDRVLIAQGPRAGDIYQYIGNPASINLETADYGNTSNWQQVNLTQIPSEVLAYVSNSSINAGGTLSLTALSNSTITATVASVSVAVSGGIGGASVSGAGVGTDNKIATNVQAYINGDGSTGISASNVSLTATDTSSISANAEAVSIAATLAIGAAISIGVSVATNEINDHVSAYIQNVSKGLTATSGGVQLAANDTSTITAISVAASAAVGIVGIAGAGAAAINTIGNTSNTNISNAIQVEAAGNVTLTSSDNSTIESLAGQFSAGTTAAIGVSVATNTISNQIIAEIANSQVISLTGGIALSATSTNTIESAAIGGSLGGVVSVAGAVTLNNITDTTSAETTGISTLQAAGAVTLTAYDNSNIQSLAGQVSVGGAAGIGAAVATNNIANNIIAALGGTAVTAGSVALSATSSGTINSTAAGGTGAGAFAAGGAVTMNKISNVVRADIANQSNVNATGDVNLTATNSATTQSMAGQITGAGGAAIGASVAVNNSSNTTQAYISDSTVVSTTGNVEAIAQNIGTIGSLSAGASVSGEIALTGSVSVNNITNTTDAYASNAIISARNNVEISATDTSTIQSLAGQLSVGIGAAGVGAAVAYNNIGNIVTAYVKADDATYTTINATGNVIVSASSTGTINTIAAGGSAGLFVGAGGSVAVNQMSNNVSAFVQNNSNINAEGSVGILANSLNTMTTKGGTFSAGFVGLGGTIAVNNLANTTSAYVDNSSIEGIGEQSISVPTNDGTGGTEALFGVAVMATSQDNLGVTIGTGGAGALTFVASVSVNNFQNTTQAYVTNNSAINALTASSIPEQSVYIKAFNDSNVNVNVGTAAGGLAAAGVGIDITTMNNTTSAYINSTDLTISQGSLVNANKDLVVEAKTQKSLTSNVVALGGGLGFSVQGAVSIINVSSGMSSDGLTAASNTQNIVDQQLQDLDGMGKDSNGNSNIATKDVSSDFATSLPNVQGTTAFITGTVSAGSDIIVNAYETTNLNISVGSLSAGLLSVGGAVGIANIQHNASAYIGDNSRLTGGNITIQSTGFVNSTTVQAVAGSAGAVGLGAAISDLSSANNSTADIGNNVTISQANNVDVISTSSSNLNAQGLGASYGLAAAGIVKANAQETGTTQAYIGNGVQIQNAQNLNVTANANEAVTADVTASSGGIISGDGGDTSATVNPTIAAYIGTQDTINVNQDVNVLSLVSVDGDAASKGGSYGAVAVGLAFSQVNSNPTINTYVGAYTTITAGGNVTISSTLGKPPVVASNTSFDPDIAVNNTANTITFTSNDGLQTGDTVVYSDGGGHDIGGLVNNGSYSVIVVNPNTIELGNVFDASTQVNTQNNTITFPNGDNFTNGQAVIYEAPAGATQIGGLVSGQKYYVQVVNSNTIQLTLQPNEPTVTEGTTLSGITTVAGVSTIQASGNVFQNGDTVTYQNRSAKFTVDTPDNIPDTGNNPNIFNSSTGDILSKGIINSASHGFETGDQVVYTGTALGGLVSGQTYYVIKVGPDHFQLSATYAGAENGTAIIFSSITPGTSNQITAVGLQTTLTQNFTFTHSNTITLANNGFTTGEAVTYQGTGIGLTDNATYYVNVIDANDFQLSSTAGGAPITLMASASTGQQSLTVAGSLQNGVTYYVENATSTGFQIAEKAGGPALAINETGLTGTGTDYLFVKQSIVALTSAGTGIQNLHLVLDSTTATGTDHTLSSGASIVLPTQGDQIFSAYSQASSGAAIAGSGATATINISPTMQTYLDTGAAITATGNVTVQGLSNVQLTGAASTNTGGIVGVGVGNFTANITNNNSTYINIGATIQAAGNVTIDGQSGNSFNAESDSTAGGLIPVGIANATVNLNHNTITTIANQASITAQGDLLVHSSSNTIGNVKADANGGGLIPFAYGTATVNVNGVNETDVNAATLTARTLTVESAVDALNVNALGLATAAGLIGIIQAKSNIYLNNTRATTNINYGASLKADELNLEAIFTNVNTNSTALGHCDGLGGKTDSDATDESNLTATINTDANSTLTVGSLNVKSGFDSFNNTNYAHSKLAWALVIWTPFGDITITLDFGTANTHGSQNAISNTNFKSNVIREARQVNPVLVIDANGQVSSQSANVSFTNSGTAINVGNISATGSGGITFSSGAASTGGSFTDNGKYSAIDPAFDTVQIQNYSNENLIINDISTISTNSGFTTPDYSQLNVSKTINTTTSSSSLSINPTVVTIDNWGTSDLILVGIIDNPHDRTILYSGGNIFSEGNTQDIITRDLTMTAINGSIGASGQRIVAQLDQGYSPVTTDVPSSNIYLSVEAENSIYLDLTAKSLDNQPVTVNVQQMTASTGEVNLAIGQATDTTNTSISSLYEFNNLYDLNQRIVAGTNIVINAGSTTTNIDAQTVFLGTTGTLDVVTGGFINVKNATEQLNLQEVISYQDAVNLSGTNVVLAGNAVVQAATDITVAVANLEMLNNASLEAGTDVTLLVQQNFQIDSDATIEAGNNVVIQGDYNNPSTTGSSISIDGWIYAQTMSIYGGTNQDIFNIQRLASVTNIYTGGGGDTVNVSSSQNRTDEIQQRLTIYGDTLTDGDTLNIDDSGDTSNSIGVLTDTSLTGLGMGEGIYYNGFEFLNINLGTGNDDFTILNTSAITNINGNAGNHTFRVGPQVDTNGNVLDETVNGVLIPGVNILGTSNITTINTGTGNDYIQVNRNTAVLNLQGGTGDDIFEINTPISNSVLLANAEVNISGDNDNDTTIINGSSLLETIQNNGSWVEVMNSRTINLMTNGILIINGNLGGTASSGGSSNTNSGSDATLSSLSDRSTSNNTNTTSGTNATLSSLSDRTGDTSSNTSGGIDPLLLGLSSR